MKDAKLERLAKTIKYKFNDSRLLEVACTHKSAGKERGGEYTYNNERLEFLGDAVLTLVCSEYIYTQRPLMSEGNLSRLRAQFICEENLGKGALNIGLNEYLISDHSMRASGSNKSKAVLADTLEAVFGAVFLDGGLTNAKNVVFAVLGEPSLDVIATYKDAKTRFQEIIQSEFREAPRYVQLGKSGPAHDPVFKIGIKVQDLLIATGEGKNKKAAAQDAAIKALNQWQADHK